jgi:hypothetical protein
LATHGGLEDSDVAVVCPEEMNAQEIKVVDMEEPVGWVSIPLTEESSGYALYGRVWV